MTADGSQLPPTDSDGASSLAKWASLGTLGFEFVAAVLLPGGLGWWVDGMLGTRPWLMLVGGMFGFVAGLYLLLRAAREAIK